MHEFRSNMGSATGPIVFVYVTMVTGYAASLVFAARRRHPCLPVDLEREISETYWMKD